MESFGDLKQLILKLLSDQGEVKASDVVKATGYSRAYVHRALAELNRDGLVGQMGKANQSKWLLARNLPQAKPEPTVEYRPANLTTESNRGEFDAPLHQAGDLFVPVEAELADQHGALGLGEQALPQPQPILPGSQLTAPVAEPTPAPTPTEPVANQAEPTMLSSIADPALNPVPASVAPTVDLEPATPPEAIKLPTPPTQGGSLRERLRGLNVTSSFAGIVAGVVVILVVGAGLYLAGHTAGKTSVSSQVEAITPNESQLASLQIPATQAADVIFNGHLLANSGLTVKGPIRFSGLTNCVILTDGSGKLTCGNPSSLGGSNGTTTAPGASPDASYLTANSESGLPNSRVLTAGLNLTVTDGGAGSSMTVATVADPTFAGGVTTPIIQNGSTITIQSGSGSSVVANGVAIDSSSNLTTNGSITAQVVNATTAIQTGGTDRIDGGGNLVNIGNITGSGAITLSTGGNGNLNLSAGSGQIILNSLVQTPTLGAATGTISLCRNSSNQISTCGTGASTATLQSAYDNGNTIVSNDASDISVTLANTATDANFLVNIASGSTGRFAVQNNGTDIFKADNTNTQVSSGNFNVSSGTIQTNGVDRLDSGGNLVNIGNITAIGPVIISTATNSDITLLPNGSGNLVIATPNFNFSAGSPTIDVNGSSTQTLTLLNSTSGQVTNLDLSDGSFETAGVIRLTNAGVLQNVTNANAGTFFTGGTLGATRGGTDQSTVATGDLLYGSAPDTWSRLATGVDGSCLIATGGVPAWGSCSAGSTTPTLQQAYAQGNTIATTNARDLAVTLADTATDSNFTVNIATGSTGKFAVQNNGTDIFKVDTTSTAVNSGNLNIVAGALQTAGTTRLTNAGVLQNVTNADASTFFTGGSLTVARGGTGAGTFTSNGVLFGNGTSALGVTGAGTSGQLLVAGPSGIPSFVTLSNDATLNSSGVLTLKNTGTAGTYGSASQVPVFTTDAQGRVTTVTNTSIAIDAAAITSGTIGVGRGGTGAGTFTTNGVLYGNGTSALGVTAAGTTGQCLIATTGSAPSFGSCAGLGSGSTLQAAYDNGATITTSDARDLSVTLANTTTDSNFITNIATGSTSKFAVQDNGSDIFAVNTGSGTTITTTGSKFLTVTGLGTATGSALCIDGSSHIVTCATGSSSATLQSAYGAGNTITTTDGRNLAVTLADTATDQSVTITQQGTASGLVLNDTNAGTGTALEVDSSGVSKLTINELGTVSTSGNISTTGSGTITSAGVLTVQGGGISVTGNSTIAGTLTGLTGLTSSGTITFSGLNTTGIVHNTGAGVLSTSLVSLTADVSGVLPIANGGTNGTATPTAGGVAYGSGSAYAFTSAGSSNQILTSGGSGAPTFQNLSSLVSSGTNISVTGTTALTVATVNNPVFSTSVTTPTLTNTGALSITSGSNTDITLDAGGTGKTVLADTTVNFSGGDTTLDITGAATRTLTLLNSTASQVANLNLSDGSLQLAGTTRISNGGAATLTSVDAGSGTIQTTGTIQGGTINATTAFQTAGTNRLDASGNLVNIGNITGSGAVIIATGTNSDLTLAPNGTGKIVLSGLAAAAGTSLCIDGSNKVVTCGTGSGSDTLQSAYDNSGTPATITTSSAAKTILFKAGTGNDSATLFNVQNAAGNSVFDVDTTNGRVGINTTTPGAKLEVNAGNLGTGSAVLLSNNDALGFKDSGGTARRVVLTSALNDSFFGPVDAGWGAVTNVDAGTNLNLRVNGSSGAFTTGLFVQGSTGNVGVGTSSPSTRQLNVTVANGSTNDVAFEANQNDTTGVDYAVRAIAIGAGGASHYALYATASGATNNYAGIFDQGNVGIGTTTPANKLQVSETITATSGTNITNVTQQTAAPSSASTGNYYALEGKSLFNGTGSTTGLTIGVYGQNTFSGGAGITAAGTYGVYGENVLAGAGTVTSATGVFGWVGTATTNPTGTITTANALQGQVVNNSNAATISTGNGLLISGPANSNATAASVGTLQGVRIANQGSVTGGGANPTTAYGLNIAATTGATSLNVGARIDSATTAALWLGGDTSSTSVAGGIAFGSSRDTNLYRGGAGLLQTDSDFQSPQIGVNINPLNQTARINTQNQSSLTGSANARALDLQAWAATTNVITTAQTGDISRILVDQLTVTSTPASTVIPDLSGLRVVGPIATGNASAARDQAILVQTGADANVGIVLRQNSSSQADILQVQTSAGVALSAISGTGRFTAPDGTSALPSFRFAGETTTGLYRQGAGALGVVGAGTEVARFDSTNAYLWVSPAADNTAAAQGIAFGASRDTNLYRSAAGMLKTDTSLTVASRLDVGTSTGASASITVGRGSFGGSSGTQAIILQNDAQTTNVVTTAQTGDLSVVQINQNTITSTPAGTVIPDLSGLRVKGPITSGGNASATRDQAILVETGADANAGIAVRQNSGSQTGDLITFQSSTGSTISRILSSGRFAAPAGTASAPGVTFQNDGTNGMFSPASGQLGFAAGGTQTLQSDLTNAYLWVSPAANNTGFAQGIVFGSSKDVGIYRSAANVLTVADSAGNRQSLSTARLFVNNTGQIFSERIAINANAAPTGVATQLVAGITLGAQTNDIKTTAQTGDYSGVYLGQQTLTSTPASTVIPDLSGLRVVGPIATGNASATRDQAILVETGADANVGLVVRANSGTQSGDLLRLTNSSNTILSNFNSAGNLALPLSGTTGTTAVCQNASNQLSTCSSTGAVGYWSRSGTTLQPANAGDNVTTSGNVSTSGSGTITAAGLLTGQAGLTVTGTTQINTSGTANTTIGNTSATGALTVASSAQPVITVNSANTNGGGIAFQNAGTRFGVIGASGWIQGDTTTDVGLYGDTGKSIKLYTNGSGTVKATLDTSGNFNLASGGFQTGGTTRLDNSGNLTNIAALTFSNGSSRTISIAQASSGTGNQLSVVAGQGATGQVGGNLLLQGGANGTASGTPGSVVVKANGGDSSTAFAVEKSDNTVVLDVDTTNQRVGIGTSGPTSLLSVGSGSAFTVDNSGNLNSSGTIQGFGLTNCTTSGSSVQWSSTTNQFSCGTAAVGARVSVLSADENNGSGTHATTTLTSATEDTNFQFTVGANETWTVQLNWDMANWNTTVGVKMAWDIPTGATCTENHQNFNSTGNTVGPSGNADCTNAGTTSPTVFFENGAPGSSVAETFVEYATIKTGSTAGTVTLNWGRNSGGTGTTTVKANTSWIKAFQTGGSGSSFTLQAAYDAGSSITESGGNGITISQSNNSSTGDTIALTLSPAQTHSTSGNLYGLQSTPSYSGAGSVTNSYGLYTQLQNTSTGTMSNIYGLDVDNAVNSGGGTISSQAGIAIADQTVGSSHTNLLVGTNTIPAGSYSIYNSSTSQNYFAGKLGIGITSPNFLQSTLGSQAADSIAAITNNSSTVTNNSYTVLRLNVVAATSGTTARFIKFFAGTTAGSDNTGTAEGSVSLNNGAVLYNTSGADFGEYFPSDGSTNYGDIVTATASGVSQATAGKPILGVMSDTIGFAGNSSEADNNASKVPVGMLGQIKVKVIGDVAVGDPIAASSTPGVGTVASVPGMIVGYALESHSGSGIDRIAVNVNPTYYSQNTGNITQGTGNFQNLNVSGTATIGDLKVTGTATIANLVITGHISGNADTRGELTIPAGQTSASITFDSPFASTPFITASAVGGFPPPYEIEKTATGFTIRLESAATADLKFDYAVQQ